MTHSPSRSLTSLTCRFVLVILATLSVMALGLLGCGDPPQEAQLCSPHTSCEEADAQCGTVDDGCGGQLDCGECSAPEVCSAAHQCELDLCEAQTCDSLDATCGTINDGCGGELACGSCVAPETCGGGGVPNHCGCTSVTCALANAQCGTIDDGCGEELDCGGCPDDQVCGDSAPNQCADAPDLCADPARQPPPGWRRLTTGTFSCLFRAGVGIDFDADCSDWQGIWNQPFPGGSGNPQRLGIGRFSPEEYLAIGFSTEGLPTDRTAQLVHEGPGSGVTPTPRIATISSCPGNFDFDKVEAETGCVFDLTNMIDRIRIGGVDTDRPCKVEPNSYYYLNIMHSTYAPGTSVSDLESNCPPDTFCGVLYNPSVN